MLECPYESERLSPQRTVESGFVADYDEFLTELDRVWQRCYHAPIIWYEIANAVYEVENGSSFLGKPYEPSAVIKNDIEYILMQRRPGGYPWQPRGRYRQQDKLEAVIRQLVRIQELPPDVKDWPDKLCALKQTVARFAVCAYPLLRRRPPGTTWASET